MGYRSNVAIAFYTNEPENIPFASIKLWFDENYPVKEAKDEWDAEITYGDTYVLVRYDDVKWYDGYEHPQAVDRAKASFDHCFTTDETRMAAWEMVRTGEESQDIEEDRSEYADYRLGVSREIIFY